MPSWYPPVHCDECDAEMDLRRRVEKHVLVYECSGLSHNRRALVVLNRHGGITTKTYGTRDEIKSLESKTALIAGVTKLPFGR